MNKKVFDEELGVVIDPEVRQILEIKEALDYGKKLEEYVMSPEFKGSIIKNEERFKLRQEIFDFMSTLVDEELDEYVEMDKIDMVTGTGYVNAYLVGFSISEVENKDKFVELVNKASCFGVSNLPLNHKHHDDTVKVCFTIPNLYTVIYDELPDL